MMLLQWLAQPAPTPQFTPLRHHRRGMSFGDAFLRSPSARVTWRS